MVNELIKKIKERFLEKFGRNLTLGEDGLSSNALNIADWIESEFSKLIEEVKGEIIGIEIKSDAPEYELAQLRYREKVIQTLTKVISKEE
jgi:hypothetical protein